MINFNTKFVGAFQYNVVEGDKIIYSSPWKKNLITNSGFNHISAGEYFYNCIKVLDTGISTQTPAVSDIAIIDTNFIDSNGFTNLSALAVYSEYSNNSATYTSFFRTAPISISTTLYEFVIKPECSQNAMGRALIDGLVGITLDTNQGLEFTYQLQVTWNKAVAISTVPFVYVDNINAAVSSLNIPISCIHFEIPEDKIDPNSYYLITLSNNDVLPSIFGYSWPPAKSYPGSSGAANSTISPTTQFYLTSAVNTYAIAASAANGSIKSMLISTAGTNDFGAAQWDFRSTSLSSSTYGLNKQSDGVLYVQTSHSWSR